jgi:hypothetical protein|tara:strand:+ start:7341 stop:7454 length:114 start_codon:yes stop_codon:yes gene_type:complete
MTLEILIVGAIVIVALAGGVNVTIGDINIGNKFKKLD